MIVDSKGNLYGVTFEGGARDEGIAYQLVPNGDGSWTENDIYDFGSQAKELCQTQPSPSTARGMSMGVPFRWRGRQRPLWRSGSGQSRRLSWRDGLRWILQRGVVFEITP